MAAPMPKLRYKRRNLFFAKDQGAIPDTKKFVPRMSCGQRHYGLCEHRDRVIYENALKAARCLEIFFQASLLRRFFNIKHGKEDKWG